MNVMTRKPCSASRLSFVVFWLPTACCLLLTTHAAAEPSTRLQEVVVTATRNEMPASQLTKAVTVVSEE